MLRGAGQESCRRPFGDWLAGQSRRERARQLKMPTLSSPQKKPAVAVHIVNINMNLNLPWVWCASSTPVSLQEGSGRSDERVNCVGERRVQGVEVAPVSKGAVSRCIAVVYIAPGRSRPVILQIGPPSCGVPAPGSR